MSEVDILECIRVRREKLSKGHKKIADYILKHYEKCAFYTATQLGNKAGVSESTVVRFPAAIGLSGYPALQKALEAIVKDKLYSYEKIDISNSSMDTETIPYNVMTMDIKNIEYTLSNLDSKVFSMAVDDILNADNVYVIGVRSCAPLAAFLAYYLRVVRKNVFMVESGNTNELFEQLIHVGENDVVIGISFPRYSMRTLKAMEFANNKNARVISITDSKHSPMNMYSSCNLFAKSDMASIADSLVAPLSIINALIVSMCIKNNKNVVNNIENIKKSLDDYRYTEDDDINYVDTEVIAQLDKLNKKDFNR